MLRSFRAFSGAAITVACLLATSSASAHTVLVTPSPLTGNDDAKTGPCGCTFGSGTIICPPDYPVTEVQAGSQASITWNETIQHTGEFRISFAAKAPEDVTVADMDDSALQTTITDTNDTPGLVTQTFTMPSTPCDLCTIQVRQFMEGAAEPYYYTCAAVRIVDGPVATTGASTTGAGPSGSGGASNGSGSGSGDGTGGADQWQPEPADGCTLAGTSPDSGGARGFIVFGAAVGLAIAVRRRAAARRAD